MIAHLHPISEDRKRAQRIALVSLAAAVGLVAAKLAAGLASGSLSILSEAAHSTLDAAATGLAFVAVRIASRPPDQEHPYGHGKAENLFALFETIGLFVLAIFLGREAIHRLSEGGAVDAAWYTFGVILVSIGVDFSRARVLRRAGRDLHSPALEADALHFTADLLTSFIVLAGLIFVRAGISEADAIGGLAVSGFVAFASIQLARRSIDVLMDRAPAGSIERITEAAKSIEGVSQVGRVRLRRVGGAPQADVLIGISRGIGLERANAVIARVEGVVHELEPGADVVVQVVPLADEQQVAEQVSVIASRAPDVTQVHNIFVASHPEGLHITLHAKFPPSMPLGQAHSIAERLESEIQNEVEGVSRVDTHLEPLESETSVAEVTSIHSTLVKWTTALAEDQSEVHDCHEVVVTESGGSLLVVMHCTAAPEVSVEQCHEASTRIESEVHRRWPEVERVTVHFEPLA